MLTAILEFIAQGTPFFFATRDAGIPYLFDPKWIADYLNADAELRLARLREER